jgi:alanyl-tRNA synthetase
VTERIYYTEPSRTEFDAIVEHVQRHEGRPAVVLDRTAFYPTSGGQPFDTGRLDDVPVVDVVEKEDGTIVHVLERELPPGQRVHGVVDWTRRFDHMQQHTGQHVLSAAFDRLYRARTVGFHLGAELSTLDLDRELSPSAIVAAEADANRIVWDDRPVSIRFVNDEQAASLSLRKEPGRTGELRIIEVADYDLSACGGTHVSRTGAIGAIAIWSSEKFRGGLRVEFLCGGRALRAGRTLRDAVTGCIRHLSVLPEELPAAIERMQAENKDLKKGLRGLQDRLAGFEAGSLAARAVAAGDRLQVVEAIEGWDANGLKALALSIISKPGYQVALFSSTAPMLAVVARSADVALDANAVLRSLIGRFGGRGGGRPDLAQGGGLSGSAEDILAAARDQMR